MPERVLVSWSGGKDCALAMHALRRQGHVAVEALLTTVEQETGRVGMHGVRAELLEVQARSIGVPLQALPIPWPCSNEDYEQVMAAALLPWRERGVRAVVFGDIHLADLRAWREHNLAAFGMRGVFPLWKRDSGELAREFLALGFEAVLACVDTRVLPAEWAGRDYDEALLSELPAGVDPCGEKGEFHTFVHAGPLLSESVRFERGGLRVQGDFAWRELLPAAGRESDARGPLA